MLRNSFQAESRHEDSVENPFETHNLSRSIDNPFATTNQTGRDK